MSKLDIILHKIRYMRPTINKRKKVYNLKIRKTKLIYTILICTIFLGAAIGSISANIIETEQFMEISNYLSKFISAIKTENINKNNIILDSVIKHSKATIIIWFMGFIPYGIMFTEIILFCKGFTCGFTTALLVRQFGFKGIIFGLASYVPQNVLLLPMYVALSFYSINMLRKRNKFIKNKQILNEYIMTLIVCFSITIFASIIESYVSSHLMQKATEYFN